MSSGRISSRTLAALLAAAFIAGIALEAAVLYRRAGDPSFVFLRRSGAAQWIRHARPMEMALLPLGEDTTFFRTRIETPAAPETATFEFRALGRTQLSIDGQPTFEDAAESAGSWKQWRAVDLAPWLSPKTPHWLSVTVRQENGPPQFQGRSEALGLASGPRWEASRDGVQWSPAATADEIAPVPGSRSFPRSDRALWSVAPWLAPVFLGAAYWRRRRGALRSMGPLDRLPGWAYHAGLLMALAVLGVNAVLRVPAWFGFDVQGHMEYIQFLIDHRSLPLATEGWKMNEAPLFYLVSSVPYRWVYTHLTMGQNVIAMRFIPLFCGLAQAEIALRTLRLVMPRRVHIQLAGAALCGLLPMNLYLSFFPSNQPFAGAWSALAVYFTLRHLLTPKESERWAVPLLAGLCLGLSILSKVTGLLTAPGVLIGIAFAAARRPGRKWGVVFEPGIAFAAMSVVSAWYFAWNYSELGTFFSVGFSESLETVWRQDPGFRAPGQLLRFGEALIYPVSAGFVGYWDSLYSTFWSDGFISSGQVPEGYLYGAAAATRPPSVPPWDFRFLGAATLLSLGPVTLIALGAWRALSRPAEGVERGTSLCLFWIGTHLAGMLYLYLTLPTVSAGKAAYLLNVLPCCAVLFGEGLAMLERRPLLQSLAFGAVATWGAASYAAFFVR